MSDVTTMADATVVRAIGSDFVVDDDTQSLALSGKRITPDVVYAGIKDFRRADLRRNLAVAVADGDVFDGVIAGIPKANRFCDAKLADSYYENVLCRGTMVVIIDKESELNLHQNEMYVLDMDKKRVVARVSLDVTE